MRCNRKQLAEFLGYDVRTIDAMVEKGMPYVKRPGEGSSKSWVFDTARVFDWLTGNDLNEKLKEVKLRIVTATATMREYELAVKTGEFVRVDDVIENFEEVLMNIKSRFHAIPGRFAQLIAVESDPAVIQRILAEEVDDILKLLDDPTLAFRD